jgi:autotransporter-associated beta strand protein
MHQFYGYLHALGSLTNSGGITFAANAGNVTFASCSIQGTGGITKYGTSKVILDAIPAAPSAYTGPTRVLGGILQIGAIWNNNDSSIPGGIQGTPSTGSNLEISNAVVSFQWDTKRALGVGPGQIQILSGRSGINMVANPRPSWLVANDANYEVVWGATNEAGNASATGCFNPTVFVMNDAAASPGYQFGLLNKIDLNGSDRTIEAASASFYAYVTGAIRNSRGTPAGLIKTGVGDLQLQGANTYNGDTTISAGTLRIGNGTAGTLGNGSYAANISIATNATLAIWSTANQTLSGVISGQGSLTKAYGGTLTLSGPNTYSGQTTIIPQTTAGCTVNVSSFNSVNGGTPLLASSSLGCPTTVGNGTIQLGSGTAQAGCTLNYTGSGETTDRSLNVVFNGSTSHTITASGAGLLKFTSAFTVSPSAGSGSLVLNGSGTGELVQGLTAMQSSGLSKQGTGTWTLSGNNTYSQATAISGGKLIGVVGGSCANSAVMVSAGTLSISVTNNTQQWVCKSLTHTAASTLEFVFGGITPSGSVAPLQVNGDTAFGVAPTVNCTGSSLPAGTYPLITWTGNLSGLAPTSATLPSGFGLLVVDTANKTLWLTIAGSGSSGSQQPLTWQGPAGNTWGANEAVYTKWKDSALVNTNYQEALVGGITVGDNVVFGATGAGAVTVNTTVSPASMQVNSTASYTFSGSGNISGIGGLTKANSGTLTLSMSNSYSGGTVLSAGTLSIAADNALGTGSVVLGGGTIQSSDATARTLNSPVVLNGSSIVGGTGNLSFTSAGGGAVAVGSTLTVNNANVNVTIGAAMSGAGSITKAGAGTMTLTGINTYSGATTVNAGTLVVNGGMITNNNAVNVTGGANSTMIITNGAKVFSGGVASYIGNGLSTNNMFVVGGSGVTSLWNLGNQELYFQSNAASMNQRLLIDGAGVAGSAVVTNLSNLWLGRCTSNSGIMLTNGASMFIKGTLYMGSSYYGGGTNNNIVIMGGAADSTFYGSSSIFCVGYGERPNANYNSVFVGAGGVLTNVGYNSGNREVDFVVGYGTTGTGAGSGNNNRLVVADGGRVNTLGNLTVGYGTGAGSFASANSVLISNGGLVSVPGGLYVGANQTSSSPGMGYNSLTVTNGGQLYSLAASYIGRANGNGLTNFNNTALISGANSFWKLGGNNLFVGFTTGTGVATGNMIRVTAGGVATNISVLTVKAANTLSLGAGGLIVAGAVTNSGTFAVGLDGSATPACGRLTVTGNLNLNNTTLDITIGATATEPSVIASYGTLTGAFSVTNGLSDKYRLEMNYKNLNQIAIVYTAAGTLIQFK